MKSRFLLILTIALACNPSFADIVKDAAREMSGLASGAANTINSTSPDQFAPRYEGIPTEAEGYYSSGNIIPKAQGNAKITDCQNIAEEDLYKRQECESINFVSKNRTIRPDVTISSEEALATGTHDIASDPTDTLTKWGWEIPYNSDGSIGAIPAETCNTELITIPAKTVEKDCSVYQGAELYLCETTLKVEVDPSFNYSCLETKYQNNTYACNKQLTVTCEQAMTCANQGILPGTTQGDMQVKFYSVGGGGYYLEFGTIGDDYWSGNTTSGTVYDKTLTFNVSGKDRLTDFRLIRAEYDDWLMVQINGATVYLGPKAGMQKLEQGKVDGTSLTVVTICAPHVFNQCAFFAELSTSWKIDLSIDLRPYLREGANTIFTRTIVGGRGESFIRLAVTQACDPICYDSWVNTCTAYESRVK